jgi:hypothetical protein
MVAQVYGLGDALHCYENSEEPTELKALRRLAVWGEEKEQKINRGG